MHRQIAGQLTGRVTKWIVLAAWIVIFVVASGFAAKLTDVQNNEASSWLPASAESTKVLDELSTTVDPNNIPTLVVYHRSSGLTEDDFAAMDEQAAEIAEIDGVTDEGVLSPNVAQEQNLPVQLVSEDGRGRLPLLHLQLRRERLDRHPGCRRRGARHRPGRRRHRAPGRLRRPGGRLRRGLRGHRHQPDHDHPARGDRDPAAHLPQPDPVAAADHQRRLRLHDLGGRGLPAGEVRRPHGQRAEPGDPRHPGHRRGHRLRPAPRRPLPRGAAPPRGPPRGDGLRAAPGGAGDPGQRRHRGGQHALPQLRRAELDRRHGARARRRHQRHLPGDGDPAPGPAGHLRSLGVLAEAADVRVRRAHEPTASGPAWATGWPPSRARSGWSPPACSPSPAWGSSGSTRPGLSTEDTYTKEFDSIKGQQLLADARPGRQLQHRPGRRQHRCPARGAGGAGGGRRPRRGRPRPGPGHRALLLRGHHQRRHLLPGRVRHRGVLPRCRPRGRRGRCPGRWRGSVLPRHEGRLHPRQQGDHPDRPGRGVPDPGRPAAGR